MEENKIYHIDRDMYRKIKKMNKKELEDLLQHIYLGGMQEANTHAIEFDQIKSAVASVPGIGEKRLSAIMDEIKKLY